MATAAGAPTGGGNDTATPARRERAPACEQITCIIHARTRSPWEKAVTNQKQAYKAPKLRRYGDLTVLTLGQTGSRLDQQGGFNMGAAG